MAPSKRASNDDGDGNGAGAPKKSKANTEIGAAQAAQLQATASQALAFLNNRTIPRLPNEVMLLIFEFSGPDMLKVFKTIPQLSGLINTYESSLYNGALKAKYGSTFPDPLAPQTAMEFVESTNARGCQDSFCDSTRKGQVRKIHWGVNVRLCLPCWKLHVQDHDWILNNAIRKFPRLTTPQLESVFGLIPFGLRDVYNKPHALIDTTSRTRKQMQLTKVYMPEDFIREAEAFQSFIISDPEDLITHLQGIERPRLHSDTRDLIARHDLVKLAIAESDKGLESWARLRKEANDRVMKHAFEVEQHLRAYNKTQSAARKVEQAANRVSREKFFIDSAKEAFEGITDKFLLKCETLKAATKLSRTPASQRAWLILKPKMWDEYQEYMARRARNKKLKAMIRRPAPHLHGH